MNFLQPAVLGGLAAIGIPIAIHLLNKFRVRRIDWAAMRFLADSLRKNERRLKIEDLILLVVRCLLFALLVLAFARPVWQALASAGTGGGTVAAMVLLDNSASMQETVGASTRFDEARQAALKWLDSLDADSLVGLGLVSTRSDLVVPNPVPDLSLARRELGAARTSDRGTDLAQGIRQAFATLAPLTGRPREIRVFTDSQISGWDKLAEIQRLVAQNPGIALVPVPIGEGGPNIAVTGLSIDGGVAAAGLPLRVRVDVANFCDAPVQNIRVSLSTDRSPSVGETNIPAIPAGGSQQVEMTISFAEPGPHLLTATTPPDALKVDNERTIAVNVIKTVSALIVEGGEVDAMADRDGYFLANALVPVARDKSLRYYLGLSFARPAALDASALEGADIVFLCNVASLAAPAAKALSDYVHKGGKLVVFPGPLSNPAAWRATTDLWNLLPAEAGPLQTADAASPASSWQSSDFEHPVTALWNDPSQGSLGAIRTLRYLPLTPRPAPPGGQAPQILVRHADGTPAALEWGVGLGRVVLFDSGVTPEMTNLPLHPAFVPLVQRLLGYLTRSQEARLSLSPGESFRLNVEGALRGREFSVMMPDGTRRGGGRVEAEGEDSVIRFGDTQSVGGYQVFVAGGERPVGAFAVQLDPAESNLRPIDPTELAALTKPSEKKTSGVESRLVITREFWPALVALAAVLTVMEMILAFRFSRAR
ncbi:MAG: hypothetical protein BGO12_09325 [Verrucomicrobia bacterium 61-8]|nr:BatA domain-containing protein [Verrucomicrobiota bacterium]OJV25302.1 MAG: hypothetical protein BGO12_09325 [Verrucomicrobia bacterium 61-8]